MTNRAHVLLWTDNTAAYLEAIKAAGLADRVAVDTLPRKEKPSPDQLSRTEALMAATVPPGLLPTMPRLRWAQAMTAGVEGWLALPDLPPKLALTCARGTHIESMPENIMASLFHVAYIYAHRIRGVDQLMIEVNPRHVRYYERMLGFKVSGPQRLNRRVSAPAVLMSLDFRHAHEQINRLGGKPELADMNRSLYPLFFSVPEEAGIVGRLRGK